jgi:O-glycosyl hydrolase
MIGEWYTHKKEEIADLLFSRDKGIGLSAWRFNIGGGKEGNRISHPWRSVETFEVSQGVYDWTRQSAESWFLHAAKERGVDQFIAFVNSPPARMTRSGYTNCNNGLGSTNLKDGYEGQFATYLADIIKHFRDDEGINFQYVSPVNEPFWEWNESNQEGNRASNNDIKNIVNALYSEFSQRDLDTEIMIAESGNLKSWHTEESGISNKYGERYGKYLTEFCNDDNINYKISKALCGHSYWSDLIDTELIQDRIELKIKFLPYFSDGWKYWQTEYMQMEGPYNEGGNGRDLTMETALNMARVIHFDMTILNASAWQWWTAVSPEDYKDGMIYTNYYNPGDNQSILEAKNLWMLGNYSRFIRPGSKRVDCLGAADKKSLMASAYKDAENGNLIIVAINVTDVEKDLSFSIEGAEDALVLTPYITSDNAGDDLREGITFSYSDGYIMPARSVVTFVGSLDEITGVEELNNLPDSHKLINNYPNPFNPDTTIEYQVSDKSRVVIDVFDTLGKKVDTLVNEVKPAGNYSVHFSPHELAGGVYIARMSCDNYTGSTKMMYMK